MENKFSHWVYFPINNAHQISGPILLYSNCGHNPTSNACLETLETIANLAGQPVLADYLAKYKISKVSSPFH